MQDKYRLEYGLHAKTQAFARRITDAKRRLDQCLRTVHRPYVGCSGGKDSEAVLLLLVEMGETNIPVMTQADDLDWSEKKAFCARLTAQLGFTDYEYCESRRSAADQLSNGDVAALEIRGTFTHVIREYETRRQTDCAILGLRAEESKGRAAMLKYRGMLTRLKSGRWLSNPIGDWSGMDVFALIVAKGAPYMKLYDCDELKAPHEWRMSWPLNPKYLKSGEAANLRRHFPAEWQRMVSINPQLRNYA